jgi:hypothetical protein
LIAEKKQGLSALLHQFRVLTLRAYPTPNWLIGLPGKAAATEWRARRDLPPKT